MPGPMITVCDHVKIDANESQKKVTKTRKKKQKNLTTSLAIENGIEQSNCP